MITMTRKLTFSAAHADWIDGKSPDENRSIFGATASPEPYGHNYVLGISVAGDIDPRTGIVVNIKDIDRLVREFVISDFDRRFLNCAIPEFKDSPTTPERMVLAIAGRLVHRLPAGVWLARVDLEPDPLTRVTLTPQSFTKSAREIGTRMQVTRVYEFSASHRLHSEALTADENRELFGKCNFESGHGHNYEVEVTVEGPLDGRTGRVVDPTDLDTVVNREVVERYDHRHLNRDLPEYARTVPSAEWITRTIWERLKPHIPEPAVLTRVKLYETSRNIFEYGGEDDA